MPQGVEKQVGAVPPVKPELHFVQVGLQMLCAEAMPRSDNAAFEQRKGRFYGISVNVGSGPHILPRAMGNGLVPRFADRLAIGTVFIGHNYVNVLGDVVLDKLRQRASLGVLRVKEAHGTSALANTENDLLVAVSEPGLTHTAPVVAANVGFVNLDSTVQHGALGCRHSSTNAMEQ